jgi:hypothetical protein
MICFPHGPPLNHPGIEPTAPTRQDAVGGPQGLSGRAVADKNTAPAESGPLIVPGFNLKGCTSLNIIITEKTKLRRFAVLPEREHSFKLKRSPNFVFSCPASHI